MPTDHERVNPLLADEWATPFGVPPFDAIRDEDYFPALVEAMRRHRDEIAGIVDDPAPPTFENTIEALERSGALLERVRSVFFAKNSAHTNDAMLEVARRVAPLLAAHADDVGMHARLYARVHEVFGRREELGADVERLRLLDQTHLGFVRSGVHLPAEAQARVREINRELAELRTRFSDNLLAETKDYALIVDDVAATAGLPADLLAPAAEEARRRGRAGAYAFTLGRSTVEPFLRHARRREWRRELLQAFSGRGAGDNAWDNRAILARTAYLRAQRAGLMGYASHAHFVLERSMAGTPERVLALLEQVWRPALEAARREARELQAEMQADGVAGELEAADWRYYAERLRRRRYDLDEERLRPYFEVGGVRDGAFDVVRRLFGLEFRRDETLPTWHADQQAFEVRNAQGEHVGVLYLDLFARPSKRGGAWENTLREQSRLRRTRPVVTLNANFPQPAPGRPALLGFTEVTTFFHELGHAVHDLLSDVNYASLAGTNVRRDFVEFPSQVLENWLGAPEVLQRFARHHATGQAMPAELLERLKRSERFDAGFRTVEYLAAAFLDMRWHTLSAAAAAVGDVNAFEEQALREIGLIAEILPRYRSSNFQHVFAGGYSAGYYSYLWSEVLDADAFRAFRERGLFDAETAGALGRLLAQGDTRPGDELYREFRGRDPEIEALLLRRGLLAG